MESGLKNWGSYLMNSFSQLFPTGNEEACYRQLLGSPMRTPPRRCCLNTKLPLPKDLDPCWERDVKSCLTFQRNTAPFIFPLDLTLLCLCREDRMCWLDRDRLKYERLRNEGTDDPLSFLLASNCPMSYNWLPRTYYLIDDVFFQLTEEKECAVENGCISHPGTGMK